MADAQFQSADQVFGLEVPSKDMDRLISLCRKAKRAETGGLLVGHYDDHHHWAFVTEVTGPPSDSRSGRTWFERGVRNLQKFLEKLWQQDRSFYLGEWHFHPFAPANPSHTDVSQMRKIADSASYKCPEPILLILGGDPAKEMEVQAFVFRRGSDSVELMRVGAEISGIVG